MPGVYRRDGPGPLEGTQAHRSPATTGCVLGTGSRFDEGRPMSDLFIAFYGLTCFWLGYLVRHAIHLNRKRKEEHAQAILARILGPERTRSDA